MQDKEFDQLFRDRLAGAEMEPPAMMWKKIEQEIKPITKKTKFPLLWMAAASAVVVVAAGLLLKQDDKIQLRATAKVQTVKQPALTGPAVSEVIGDEPMALPAAQTAVHHQEEKSKKIIPAMEPMTDKQHLSDITPAEDMMEDPIMATPLTIAQEVVDTKQAFALNSYQDEPTATAIDLNDAEQDNKKGIRNIGDLVNFVVDKVDKRDEKLLEFHTDDDDQSSLVAINIGFLKLNTKNRIKR